MFCENCGKPLKEDQHFCPDCGTPAGEPAAASRPSISQPTAPERPAPQPPVSQQPAPEQPAAKAEAPQQEPDLKAAGAEAAASLKTLFGSLGAAIAGSAPVQKFKAMPRKKKQIIGGAAGAMVLVLVCVLLFGGRGYKKTVDRFIDGIVADPDAKAVLSLVPKQIFEEMGFDEDDMEDYLEEMEDVYDMQQRQLREALGKDWKLTYTITDDEQLDKDELEDLRDDYEDSFEIKVKDARTVRVRLRFKGSEDNSSATMRLPLVKIGHSWYIDYMNQSDFRVSPNF